MVDILTGQVEDREWTPEEQGKETRPPLSLVTSSPLDTPLEGLRMGLASITMKLKRGTFAATWLLATLAALEMDGIRLEDL